MFQFHREQSVCDIGGVRVGGRPGDHPTVLCSSIFQKGDRVFEGKRKGGFDEKRAAELLGTQEALSQQTGIPCMADIVANTGSEFKTFIDFVTSIAQAPFCIDAWTLKAKLQGAAYCAEKGLMDRMLYNSLTVWEKDVEAEIREIWQMGVRHVLLVAFDQEDPMPSGRVKGTQKLLDAIEKVGADFESVIVDTSVMNAPATALCGLANRMIKEKWGLPTASAPANGSYMWKQARELWGFKGWAAVDAVLQGLASVMCHDMIFCGPMAGASRVFPAVAAADAFLATAVFLEEGRLPKTPGHPLHRLFPDFVEQLRSM